jgi:biopolymer transport protein ExbD
MAAAVRTHTHRTGFTRHVALIAANAAPYAVIIRILDAARQAGDDDVGFVTY